MTVVARLEKPDAVINNVRKVIDNQKSQAPNPMTAFLDEITAALLSDVTFQRQNQVRDSGLFAVLFPREYSDFMRDRYRKPNFPYMQQVQCLVIGNEKTVLNASFNFLQPKLRRLRHKITTSKGQERFQVKGKVEIDGEEYTATVEDVINRSVVSGQLKIGDLLKKRRHFSIAFDDKPQTESIPDKNGNEAAQYVHEVPSVNGVLTLYAEKISIPGYYKITMKITNNTDCKSSSASMFSAEEVARRCFYGTYATLTCKDGKIVSPTERDETIKKELNDCANVNTSPLISRSDPNMLFCTPIILHDYPRIDPVPMDVTLDELAKSEESLLKQLDKLTKEEKTSLVKRGKIKILHKVVQALAKTKPDNIQRLHKFQWDGIQIFIKKLLSNDNKPLMIRAPTDSGKSLIFYVCSVLMKAFRDELSGTIVFITFPTRALNSQQFSEMVDFFYQLNQHGIKVSLGLYMGSGVEDTEIAVRSVWPPDIKEGHEIIDIEKCPNCGSDHLVAHKPDDRRIIPKCITCETELDFVYLSNMETEAFCPNVVVGTPDKIINALTTSVFSHTIFGAPCKKCPNCGRHSLLSWKNQGDAVHQCKSCNIELGPETRTNSTPCFVVFDEVHTLSGTQGNLLGQFLSLMKVTNELYGLDSNYWYLGATATIHNQKTLVKNLTGFVEEEHTEFPQQKEFWFDGRQGYFALNTESIRHRYLVLEPLARSARWSVSNMTISGYSILKEVLASEDLITKKLSEMGCDVTKAYKVQTIYVLRKSDGRNLENYIPTAASRIGMERPVTLFGSGDLQRVELVKLNRRVREQKLDVLVVTQIYGQGVDFPGLNIIHFFGIPRSFIELAQVVGRTGRGKAPGLVLLHMVPEIPRDQWVYKNFRNIIEKLEDLYEPMPINVMNRFAISMSLPNVFNALVLARTSSDYRMRFADYVHKHFNDKNRLKELMEQIYKVYLRSWITDKKEIDRIKKIIFNEVVAYLLDFRTSRLDTTKALSLNRLLISSLRDPRKQIPYTEITNYPLLEELRSSELVEEDFTEEEEGNA